MGEFRMPSLGADMEEGTLVTWMVAPGDVVKQGDIVAVVETAKGAIEVETLEGGRVATLQVGEGDKVPVGTLLATLDDPDGSEPTAPAAPPASPPPSPAVAPAPATAAAPPAPEPAAKPPAPTSPPTPALHAGSDGVRATPAARRAADAEGVALASLSGTGPEGAVVLRDVTAAPASVPAPTTPATPGGEDTMMAVIARAMARSKREIPHYYLASDIDLGTAMDWLTARNADRSVEERMLPAALFIKATARVAKKHPELNGFFVDGAFRPSEDVHVGVAISLRGGGLVSPAIHHADQLELPEIMARLSDLVLRARDGHLRNREMADPTITVTSMGTMGVPFVLPVIVPPQVCIIGFGKVTRRPWVVDDAVVPRPVVTATLAADHRVSNGHRGGVFLAGIERKLQNPEKL